MNLLTFWQSPQLVQVDLLVEYPDSTDPSTWLKPAWDDYAPSTAAVAMDLVTGQGGLIEFAVTFFVPNGAWLIKAYAVSQNGTCRHFGNLDPTSTTMLTPGTWTLAIQTVIFERPT